MAYAYIYSQNNITVRDEVSYGTVPGSPLTVTGTINSGNYEDDDGFVSNLVATPDGSKLFGVFQADKGLYGYNTSDWSRIDVSGFNEDDKLFANDLVRRFISALDDIRISPDGTKLAITINSSTYEGVVVYATDPVSKITEYNAGEFIQEFCWGADSDTIFIGTSDETITRLTASTGATLQSSAPTSFDHKYLVLTNGGDSVVSGQRFSSVDFGQSAGFYPDTFDAEDLTALGENVAGADPESAVSVPPYTEFFANEDGTVVAYDATTFSIVRQYTSNTGFPFQIAASQDGEFLVAIRGAGPSSNNVYIYNTSSPTPLNTLSDPQARFPAITHGLATPPPPPEPTDFWTAFNGTKVAAE